MELSTTLVLFIAISHLTNIAGLYRFFFYNKVQRKHRQFSWEYRRYETSLIVMDIIADRQVKHWEKAQADAEAVLRNAGVPGDISFYQ